MSSDTGNDLSNESTEHHTSRCRNFVIALLVLHFSMLSWIAVWNAPVGDEVGHLTAGLYSWKHGTFFLYRVNPPLVKLLAAIPAAVGNPKTDWTKVADGPAIRTEFDVGRAFMHANAPHGHWYHTAGRLLCLPLTVLGGWMCWLWARTLYGAVPGIVACALWCFNPIVFGWGSTFTPDAASASFGLVATWYFRRWLVNGTWASAAMAGVMLGVCELTKTTWIILYPLLPLLWLLQRNRRTVPVRKLSTDLQQLTLLICVSLYVLNVGYGFEGSGRQLGKFDFVSQTLTGNKLTGTSGNRFRDTFLGHVPVPLPYNYVRGIDLQKVDFEKGMESYLWGTWSDRGWWYYYPVAATLKLPLGLVLLFLAAFAAHFFNRQRFRLTPDELLLMVPATCVILLICSQTGFTRYVRYLLPAIPTVFVLVSKFWRTGTFFQNRNNIAATLLLAWAILSPVMYFPNGISYFNELAGGPANGYRYLLDANVDWGQDQLRLKSWVDSHPDARPLFCIHTGFVSPADLGIECGWPPKMDSAPDTPDLVPEPGWYAVSIHELYQRHGYYRYLRKYVPVARIGYSTLIFHISQSET